MSPTRRVVVVEDDPHNAVLFRKLLEKRLGCDVTVTESPEELFEAARSGEVRLVVMDVSLAHSTWQGQPVNGVALCRMLKSDPATAAIPVLLATAHAMRGDAERLLQESGADDYISKPIVDHSQFVEQVRALVQEAA
ncbi:MAG: response regulator [Candidatus Eisenbacteria bacterium]|uniref:Response regulator n=1 Tax=Eiseniibacteriota bacterium TaxID=2212470 RepID=A0A933SDI1_UNCEI|nr:response regulator [Candidatus Eisenbacteria bacterium]